MVKKIALISLAVVLMLAMANIASAKPSVANTSQKGSLLVFPKIIAFDNGTSGTAGVDTYVMIGNDGTSGKWIKCYWMDNNQTSYDFMFYLTPNQPVVFSSFYGYYGATPAVEVPPFLGVGALTCWVSKEDDSQPQNYNHLYGNAMVSNLKGADAGTTFFYNAYSFQAIGDTLFSTLTDDSGGIQLRFTGDTPPVANRGYDACPKYLVFNFIPYGVSVFGEPYYPDLTLWPCRQDLRQDRIPTCTKAKFDIWNENEVKFTGSYQCFKCFFEGFLTDIGNQAGLSINGAFLNARGPGYGGNKFTYPVLQTESARARVQGIYSSVCIAQSSSWTSVPPKTRVISGPGCPNISADGTKSAAFTTAWGTSSTITPLLGVLMYAVDDATSTDPVKILPHAGHTVFGAGAADWTATGEAGIMGGWIKYNPGWEGESAKR